MSKESARTSAVRSRVELALHDLSEHFLPECKLTFIMRKPGEPDCFMVVTDDNPSELATLLGQGGKS